MRSNLHGIHLSVPIKANLDFEGNILKQSIFEEFKIQDQSSDDDSNILAGVLRD